MKYFNIKGQEVQVSINPVIKRNLGKKEIWEKLKKGQPTIMKMIIYRYRSSFTQRRREMSYKKLHPVHWIIIFVPLCDPFYSPMFQCRSQQWQKSLTSIFFVELKGGTFDIKSQNNVASQSNSRVSNPFEMFLEMLNQQHWMSFLIQLNKCLKNLYWQKILDVLDFTTFNNWQMLMGIELFPKSFQWKEMWL